jgi:hypothetical protein
MTSCERAHSLYGPAWDDELSVSERESLERHFNGCPACRRDYDEYARTLELVQSLPRPVVSADFAARVVAEARRREAERPAARRFAWPWSHAADRASGSGALRMNTLAWAAALFVVAGTSALVLTRPGLLPGGSGTVPNVAVATGDADTPSEGATVAPAPTSAGTEPSTEAMAQRSSSGGPSTPLLAAVPASTGTPKIRTPRVPHAASEVAAVPESLFDHTADVEFVLDPVKMRRERGRGYTPVPTNVRGENASITF